MLGSFAVATWSDLKRLSAQREFLEIWLAFLAAMLAIDIYEARVRETTAWQVLAVKWGLIVLFSLSPLALLRLPYRLFRLAPADAAALAAAASLLTPILIIVFYLGAKLLSKLIGPLRAARAGLPFHAGREPGHAGRPRRGLALASGAGRLRFLSVIRRRRIFFTNRRSSASPHRPDAA